MRFGPTSLEVSSILAKGLHRPKLRTDLKVSQQTIGGETSYVVKNPETNTFNRYGATEYELLSLCDGTRTAAEVAAEITRLHPDEPLEQSDVRDFLDSIEPEMWERSLGEKNLAVLERIRQERKSRLNQSSLLYITFKAWDPDKTLARLDPYLGWLFTRGFVVFSILIFLIALCIWAGDWDRIGQDTVALYSFANKTSYDIWIFWFLMLGLSAVHELGHGLTCKHFGGDVHQMGFMLIYLTPAFYTDTTDILLFDRTSRREWVIFAGIWVELTVCALSTLVWHFTLPGSFLNDLAYKTLLFSGIQAALLNLNPLIKADGYYALSQYLRIDNLREDSFAYLLALVRRFWFRQDIELPAASRRERRIFLAFGIAAIVYSAALIALVLLFALHVFTRKFGAWGYFLMAALLYLFLQKRFRKALPAIRHWLRKRKGEFMAWKITRAQQISGMAIALLLVVPPLPSKVSTDFVLEPGEQAQVRAEAPGRISRVFVHQGEEVSAGELLATLENPELQARAAILKEQLAEAESRLRRALAGSDHKQAAKAAQERQRSKADLDVAQKKLADLDLRAPISGVVTTTEVEERAGEYLSAGEEFLRLSNRQQMRARILVRDWQLQDVSLGAPVKLKARAYPLRTFTGRVEQILPAAALDQPVSQPQKLERYGQELTNYFAVVLEFPNPDGSLQEGMTGTAKILGKNRPLAWQAGEAAWRWLRSQIW